MTNNQLFTALAGVLVALFAFAMGFFKHFLDAKFETVSARFDGVHAKLDSLSRNIDNLIQFMMTHESRISTLEERTKHL
jgi:hypothetical protein